jgi:hypothetical protein
MGAVRFAKSKSEHRYHIVARRREGAVPAKVEFFPLCDAYSGDWLPDTAAVVHESLRETQLCGACRRLGIAGRDGLKAVTG